MEIKITLNQEDAERGAGPLNALIQTLTGVVQTGEAPKEVEVEEVKKPAPKKKKTPKKKPEPVEEVKEDDDLKIEDDDGEEEVEEKKPAKKKASKKKSTKKSDEPISRDQVFAYLTGFMDKHGRGPINALVKKLGAEKLTDLDSDKYGEFLERLEAFDKKSK